MLNGLYSAAGALELATRNQEIVAENLAHVTTPGYRRQGLIFDAFSDAMNRAALTGGESDGVGFNPTSFSHFDAGPMQQTGSPFDLAITGNAFFAVDGPNGPLYTRNGAFQMDANGQLVSRGSGYPVRGQGGGAITLPTNIARFTVGGDGTISANGQELGRLELASFERPDLLRRVGTTYFEGDNPQSPPPDNARVEQGFREGSNVQAVQEMISMMLGMRYYEAAQRSMRAIAEAVARNTQPLQA